MKVFDSKTLEKLYKPAHDSSGEDNGQVTIIGGSKLFHGAPILSLKVASRVVDMVFFASPEKSVGYVAEQIKSKLMSFIWVPWEEADRYIEKSDAVLIGPGFMSYRSEKDTSVVEETKDITKTLLEKFPDKKWVIDAGSLQVIDPELLPRGSVVTPNKREFKKLFKIKDQIVKSNNTDEIVKSVEKKARECGCTIVLKGPETIVCSPDECALVKGGNAGMTKGGTGDVLAGLTVALLAKNDAFLAATAASFIEKKTADVLYEKVGTHYNADDLADYIPEILHQVSK